MPLEASVSGAPPCPDALQKMLAFESERLIGGDGRPSPTLPFAERAAGLRVRLAGRTAGASPRGGHVVENRHAPVSHDDKLLLLERIQPADENVRAKPEENCRQETVTSARFGVT